MLPALSTSFAPAVPAAAEHVLAGTLCLMSCFTRARLPVYADHIAQNLRRLGNDDALSAEMRALCERLALRWQRIHADSMRTAIVSGPPADARRLH